jgi:hypothetical protein
MHRPPLWQTFWSRFEKNIGDPKQREHVGIHIQHLNARHANAGRSEEFHAHGECCAESFRLLSQRKPAKWPSLSAS